MLKTFDIPIGWGELFKRTLKAFNADKGLGLAAQLSYYLLLALAPAVVALLALTSFLPGDSVQRAIDTGAAFLPEDMQGLLAGLLENIKEGQDAGLLTFGFLLALWSSSAAVVAISDALNQVYDIEESRPWWRVRLSAIGLTLVLALFVLLAIGLVLFGPFVAEWLAANLGYGAVFEWSWKILQWPLVFALIATAIAVLNYWGPDAEQDWAWISAGAVLATALWLIASLGFKLYVGNFADYNATYGSLGGVIVLMLWFYISSIAILIGSEMNAEIEHASPHGKEAGEKVPGEKKKIGAAAARAYEARQKKLREARAVPAPRPAHSPRAFDPAPVHSHSMAERILGLPVFLALWFRRRRKT